MTDHDALCPTRTVGHAANTACWCAEIAKVRADERQACLEAVRLVHISQPVIPGDFLGDWCDRGAYAFKVDAIEALMAGVPTREGTVERPDLSNPCTTTPRDSEPSTGRTGART